MDFLFYILYSPTKDRYYIGHSNDLNRRLYEHNSGFSKSTKSGIPWNLVCSKQFNSRSEATKFESEVKRMKSRKYIEQLIKSY